MTRPFAVATLSRSPTTTAMTLGLDLADSEEEACGHAHAEQISARPERTWIHRTLAAEIPVDLIPEVQARDERIAALEAALWGMIFHAANLEADLARADEWSTGAGRCSTLVRIGEDVAQCSRMASHTVCWSDRRRDCCDEHLVDSLRVSRTDGSDATDHPIVDGNLWQNHPLFSELEPRVQEAMRTHDQTC